MIKKRSRWIIILATILVSILAIGVTLGWMIFGWHCNDMPIKNHMPSLEDKYSEICYRTSYAGAAISHEGYVKLNDAGFYRIRGLFLQYDTTYYLRYGDEDGLSSEDKELLDEGVNFTLHGPDFALEICRKLDISTKGWFSYDDMCGRLTNAEDAGSFYFHPIEKVLLFRIAPGELSDYMD